LNVEYLSASCVLKNLRKNAERERDFDKKMSTFRQNFNHLFPVGTDSFAVACVTAGSIIGVGLITIGARAVADGSASRAFFKLAIKAASNTPGISDIAARQRKEAADIVSSEILKPDPPGVSRFERIPDRGMTREEILRQLEVLCARDEAAHKDVKHSGCIYWGDHEHSRFLARVQELFLLTNPLHPDTFPAIGKFERELIKMTKCMLGAQPDDSVCGAVTSGEAVVANEQRVDTVCRWYGEHSDGDEGVPRRRARARHRRARSHHAS
jgi:hypothetical protein